MNTDDTTSLRRDWAFGLRFPEPLEAEFRAQYRQAFRGRMQALWIMFAVVWLVYVLFDRTVHPDAPRAMLVLQMATLAVLAGTAAALSFAPGLGTRVHALTTVSSAVVGILAALIFMLRPSPGISAIFWAIVAIGVMATIFATTLHYTYSVAGSAVSILAFTTVAFGFAGLEPGAAAVLVAILVGSFVSSLGTTNTIEQYARQTFAAKCALERQKEALAEKALQLEISEAKARDANRAKSVFLSNMSHELRTPLNAVLGFAQLTEQDPSLSSEGRENLRIIERSGDHLLSLIDDVLAISKIEAGRVILNEHIFDPAETLRSVVDMIRVRTDVKGLQLIVTIDEMPRRVIGDEGKLRQVFVNLLGNAVKFTETGGIGVRAQWTGTALVVEIEDTGAGIAADEIGGLFEAFAQSESGRRSTEGTGLGLAISRSFIRLMGGDIRVESERSRGTTFTVEVPLLVTEVTALEEKSRRVVRLATGQPAYRVLVVDDTAENRLLLTRLLAPIGFEVREAVDGSEAVESWKQWQPDLIFMDMRMPVMDGYAATEQIRSLSADHRTRIIALTASAFQHDRERILASGCDDFVTKPFRVATIFEKLAEHLGAEFVYGEADPVAEVAPNGGALCPDSFADVPADLTAQLRTALEIGDPEAAKTSIDRILEIDEPLGLELRRLVRAYRYDEIQAAIGES